MELIIGDEGIIDTILGPHPILSILAITIRTFLFVVVLRSPPYHTSSVEILLNNTTHRGFADPISLNAFRLIAKFLDTCDAVISVFRNSLSLLNILGSRCKWIDDFVDLLG